MAAAPPGRDVGFAGLHVTTDAVARLGQLHLQCGRWGGEELLAAAWVDDATRSHIPSSERTEPDWAQGYGYQLWISRHGYRGDGAFGQFCLVLPEADAVVAITAATTSMQTVLDAVWQHLLPALTAGAAPEEEAALAQRLAGLSLPVVPGQRGPVDPRSWDGAAFTPRADPEQAPWSP